ncbi:MAG TPA: HlyD family efflux transporter periplasmic adaptor subunit [Thermoanaerobaculia bacterium]|nr:HlyD family efflux transporter periplasmic adaptor subunit [Thermoanaerobaculia bacterium]
MRQVRSEDGALVAYAATLRALDSERSSGRMAAVAAAAVLLVGWLAWAFGAEVPVTVDSTSARIAPAAPPRVLVFAADGMLTSRRCDLGQRVRAGEVLATLDSRDVAARLGGLAARRAALMLETAAVAAQQAALGRAQAEERAAETAAGGERQRRSGEAAAAEKFAEETRARDAQLEAAGLVARAAAARSRAEAEQRRQAAAAVALAGEAGNRRGRAALAERDAAGARLAGELSRLRGELAALAVESDASERELGRRSVRAPVAGRLAEVTTVQVGATVVRGTPLATLVPDGPLVVVAGFAPPGGAAVRAGLRAWVWLPAGPAAGAVTLPARVAAVAPAPRPGEGWEVRLALPVDAAAWSLLARVGEPCRVEVELGRETPAGLALRGLGRRSGRASGEVRREGAS